ncbi:MAG: hypothetical protein JST89_08055 [Cyanobacteria bacterium SZAS-4]|nr:hypothetical protein [Cyanobacteria bacterium SZAS-4]
MRSSIIIFTIALLSLCLSQPSFANSRFETNSITPNILVIYFHSYGSNYTEAFDAPSPDDSIAKAMLKDIPGVAILSIDRESKAAINGSDGYREVSELTTQCWNDHPSLKHIVLCGTSLGAYESLAYLHYTPQPIFDKVCGIISVEPTDDLADLFYKTRSAKVQELLFSAFGGDPIKEPDYYRSHSIKTLFSNVPNRPDIKICIVSAKRDRVVPPYQQKRLCNTLREKKFQVQLVEIDRAHSVADSGIYGIALHYVTGRYERNLQPLTVK